MDMITSVSSSCARDGDGVAVILAIFVPLGLRKYRSVSR